MADLKISQLTTATTPLAGSEQIPLVQSGSTKKTTVTDLMIQNINAQTGTTYTLVLTDANRIVTLANASAITLTVPTNASVAFPVGTTVTIAQTGAGQVTVSSSATIRATPGAKLRARYSTASLIKIATDEWLLVGDLTS